MTASSVAVALNSELGPVTCFASPASASLMAPAPSNHPLENSVVIDNVCSFLHGDELPNCRLVNKQWNSSCVRLLKKFRNFVNLRDTYAIKFVAFLNKRDENIEWFPQYLKYSFSFGGFWDLEEESKGNLRNELAGVQELVDRFGPGCIHSVTLWDGPFTPELYAATCTSVGQIIRDCPLDDLFIQLPDWIGSPSIPADVQQNGVECVIRMMNSAASITKLSIEQARFESCEVYVSGLEQVDSRIWTNLQTLYISPDHYEPWQKLIFPEMKTLEVAVWGIFENDENYGLGTYAYPYPHCWSEFRDFVRKSCPALIECILEMGEVGQDEFRRSLEEQEINIQADFPDINFKIRENGDTNDQDD